MARVISGTTETYIPFDDISTAVEMWNEEPSQITEAAEAEEVEERAGYLWDIVLNYIEPEELARDYSHIDGIASLPRQTSVIRTSAIPVQGPSYAKGGKEQALRNAVNGDRIWTLRTKVPEPDWPQMQHPPFRFLSPNYDFEEYVLPPSANLVEEVKQRSETEWNKAKLSVSVLGNGGGGEGIVGNLARLFTSTDWLSLYRSTRRTLFAWKGRSVTNNDDLEILNNLESHLFSVEKYLGNSELMTIATWGEGQYGTLSLYRATLQAKEPRAQYIAKLAFIRSVPKAIIRRMKSPSCIKIVHDVGGRIRCLGMGGTTPVIAKVETFAPTTNRSGTITPWAAGESWRSALGIARGPDDTEALVATIPQMLAFIHIMGSKVDHTSTPAVVIGSEPLQWSPDPRHVSPPSYDIKRAVSISPADEIDILAHPSGKTRINVFFPRDADWAKENILWV